MNGFCRSNVRLNWWSAAAWCKANGMKLATMYEMCPSWDGNTGSGKCPEMSGLTTDSNIIGWSATAKGSENAFVVRFQNGEVYAGGQRHELTGGLFNGSSYAMCR